MNDILFTVGSILMIGAMILGLLFAYLFMTKWK